MYDSRSNHPRNGIHWLRSYAHEYGYYTPHGERGLNEKEAIAEQMVALVEADEPARVIECETRQEYAEAYRMNAAWHDPNNEAHIRECSDCAFSHALDNGFMDGEYNDPDDGPEYDEDEDDAYWVPGQWMPHVSVAEVCQTMTSGWHVTGPPAPRNSWGEPYRTEHYIRVYEIVRETGVPTATVIAHLRNARGEFVVNNLSMVARPVAERVIAQLGVTEQQIEKSLRDQIWEAFAS